ncbi:DNA primase [Chryseobacterium sp. A301]
MISQKTIDAIFSAIRVEEIIGEYVVLKRAGSNLKGLSPFKDEKTASFVVSPSKQIWKDFSTGKGGSAISFLMEIENFTYPEALRFAAKKYGIQIEETLVQKTPEELAAQDEKELLYKIHEIAADFFKDQLFETEEGQSIGLAYFKERQIKKELIEKFQLGYSPEKKDEFTEYALDKGYSKELLESSGLSVFPSNAPTGVDRFRDRVIFPIHSFSGRVLGFGARILKNHIKTAKYLNSPETGIYHKSDVLYGLNQSKQAISKQNLCLLVEGYMDVIALHQAGIEHVVSSSGTALTTAQIKLIKRLTQNVTILFDGDAAGIRASFRSIDLLLAQGMNIRILLFPDGHDPDSFAKAHEREYVESFIQNEAQDFINFKAEVLLKDIGTDPIKKAESITDIVRSIGYVENPLQQEIYLKEVADRFSLSPQNLFNELSLQKQVVKNEKPRPREARPVPTLEISQPDFQSIDPMLLLEEKLFELLFKYGEKVLTRKDQEQNEYEITVLEEIVSHFQQDGYEMRSSLNTKIFNAILEGLENAQIRTGGFFLTLMDQELNQKAADALLTPYENSDWGKHNIYFDQEYELVPQIVEQVLIRHKRTYVLHLIEELKKELETGEDADKIYTKIIRLNQLKIQMDQELHRIM